MAIKHRKLFLPTPTNQTTYCLECEPYDYDPILLPPPPPPSAGKTQPLSPYLIILVGFLAISFLLVSYYVVIVKYCSGWIPFRRRQQQTQQPQPSDEDGFIDQNQRPVIDHPIWYINTIGLQQSVINSISIFNYKKGDFLIEGKECIVCLGEFQEDERLRLLPKCNHAFHIHCIDTWLRSHTNCPLCRAAIVSNTAISLSGNNGSIDLNPQEETQMENLERESEFGSTRENWGETGDGDGDEAVDDEKEVDVSASIDEPSLPENSASFSGNVRLSARPEMGCSSFRVESQKKKHVSMKRSVSCGVGGFFYSLREVYKI